MGEDAAEPGRKGKRGFRIRRKEPASEGPPEEAAPVDPKTFRARIASAAIIGAVAGTEFASVALTRDLVVAAIWAILGGASVLLAYFLFRGRFTAWGTAMILNSFALLLAVVLADLFVIATLIASFVVLYVARLPFGVGAWKIEAGKEDERTRGMIGARTANPEGLRCPKCGSTTLWIGEDGSGFCLSCRAGTIDLRPRGAG